MTHSIQLIAPRGNTISITACGTGRTVILLHGFPLDSRMWQKQLTALEDRFHVLAIDMRGFGGSTLDEQVYSIADLASDVDIVRQHLASNEPIVLVGLSMGGYVALEYYRCFGKHLAGLVLANTKPQSDTDAAKLGRLKMADEALQQGTWAAVAAMLPRLLADNTLVNDATTTQFVELMMRSVRPATIWAAQHAMANRNDFTSSLKTIRVPTLVVTGQLDPISTPENNASWSQQISEARLHVIPGVGHLPPLESPDEFNTILIEFLNSVLG